MMYDIYLLIFLEYCEGLSIYQLSFVLAVDDGGKNGRSQGRYS